MKDREVVDLFVDYLANNGYPGLKVNEYPEDRNPGDIDAIAGKFAIEHTSVDPLPNQRLNASWFMQAAGELEAELSGKIPFRLEISLDYDAVAKGQKWSTIKEGLRTWITKKLPDLLDGRYVFRNIPGVPFPIHVEKSSSRIHGVFFARRGAPQDDAFADRIRQQIERKAAKLEKYQGSNFITILLVERYSIAMMSNNSLLQGIRRAFPAGLPKGVDEIWCADTSIPSSTYEANATDFVEFHNLTPKMQREKCPEAGSLIPFEFDDEAQAGAQDCPCFICGEKCQIATGEKAEVLAMHLKENDPHKKFRIFYHP